MGAGTALGSDRNVPIARRVTSWAAKPEASHVAGSTPGQAQVRLAQVAPAAQPVPLDVLGERP